MLFISIIHVSGYKSIAKTGACLELTRGLAIPRIAFVSEECGSSLN